MRDCKQSANQSVLQHGYSVWKHFQKIVAHIETGEEIPDNWRIPPWAYTPGLIDKLANKNVIREYLIMHDCSKPFVLEIDEDGRRHFPNHARESEKLWLAIGGSSSSARLMGMDMDAHLLKNENVEEFSQREEAVTLLFSALAEVHSNAAMFGGFDSDSFKIKAKHLLKKGKAVIERI
jgi:hypothetical protein